MHRLIVLATILTLSGQAAATEQKLVPVKKPVEIAVMEFSSKGGVTQKQMEALEDMLTTIIRELGNYRVIAGTDLRAVLKIEQQKQLMGCNNESCAAEIGGALGVRWVLTGNVSLFGKTYLLNMKLIDAQKVRIVTSVSKKIQGEQDKLVDALPGLTRKLMAQSGLGAKKGPTSGGGMPSLRERAPAHPYSTWGHVTLWSGVGLVALGGVSAYMASSKGDEYEQYGDPDDRNASRNWSGIMWTGFSLGAVLVATGIVLWVLEPEGESDTSFSTGPMPDGSGWAFSLGGRW